MPMQPLRKIPKIDKVLLWAGVRDLLDSYPRPFLLACVRRVLDELRAEALSGGDISSSVHEVPLTERIRYELAAAALPGMRRVINGTGVVVHTNLGRSPLPEAARTALHEAAFGYTNLEFDLGSGERGERHAHVEGLIKELTGAEAALVVNNNAAAVLLALSSLACGREVVVSRGELVEIGGSFRIPDVMIQSGALLREVGTTNRTHRSDYREAVTTETALLLKVHPSNFKVSGFTSEVGAAELAALGKELSVPVMADVGSGSLLDLSGIVTEWEPMVQDFVRCGVDVITFSGDKLLGGPQAGLIAGRADLLAPMRKHPLLRAVRIDKLSLAALEATLRLYRDGRRALKEIPTLRMLTVPVEELRERGRNLVRMLQEFLPETVRLTLVDGTSQAGGGALPLMELPTCLICVEVGGLSPQRLEESLRRGNPPVVGRIRQNRYLLDVRTILEGDIPLLKEAFGSLQT